MIESPLQKALRRVEENTPQFKDTGFSTNLIEVSIVEEILQDMEAEMTAQEYKFDKNVVQVKR